MSCLIVDRTATTLQSSALCFFARTGILFVSGFPCASVRSIGVYRSRRAWRGFAICRLRQLLLLRASPLPLPFFRGTPLSRDSDYILATSCMPTLPCRVQTVLRFTGEQKARQRATWDNFAWTIAIITIWQNKFVILNTQFNFKLNQSPISRRSPNHLDRKEKETLINKICRIKRFHMRHFIFEKQWIFVNFEAKF